MPEKIGIGKPGARALFGVLVGLAFAAGLAAPWIIRGVEDRRVERQNEEESAIVFQGEYGVRAELTLPEKLRLAGDNVFIGPFPHIGARTEEETEKLSFSEKTLETVRLFLRLWYDEEDADTVLRNVSMVNSESYYARTGSAEKGFVTSVVWRCRFIDGKGNVMWLVIDDATEEVLAFRAIVRDLPARPQEDGTPEGHALIPEEQWKEFAEGTLSEHFAPCEVKAGISGEDHEGDYMLYTLEFSEGADSVICHLEIMAGTGSELIINFNQCATEW